MKMDQVEFIDFDEFMVFHKLTDSDWDFETISDFPQMHIQRNIVEIVSQPFNLVSFFKE